MKKVAFFSEILIEDFDGANRTMFHIINRIDPRSFTYLFVYGKGPDQFKDHLTYQVPTFRVPVNDDYSFAVPQLSKWKLEQALNAFNPDVIHIATPSLLGFFALNYAKKNNIPVISIYHTHFISYISYYLRNFSSLIKPIEKWTKKTMARFYNGCDMVYVPTQAMMKELQKIGIDSDKMALWQRGIDMKLFSNKKRDVTYIQQITQNEKPNILFASRLVWEKNIHTLIDIYRQLNIQQLDCNLIIAGDGSAKDEAMHQMPNAIFLGKLDHEELSKLYASSDIFVFTSISETYGNVVVEAMASGLPCIIANGGGSASLIEHAVTGYKCNPTNAKEYVYYIQKLLSNQMLYARMQAEAFDYIQNLDWRKLTETYFDDIRELANSPQNSLAWVAS